MNHRPSPLSSRILLLTPVLALFIVGCSGSGGVTHGGGLYGASWIPDDRPREFDLEHLLLDVTVDHAEDRIDGYVEHRLRLIDPVVDSITLDAGPKITVDSVTSGRRPLGYAHYDRLLRIERPAGEEAFSVRVYFRTEDPDRGLFFTHLEEGELEGVDGFWTQGEPTDHHRWFPLADRPSDLATTETVIRTRSDWKVVSNGRFLGEREVAGDLREWHYRMDRPHAPYLLMIAGADYLVTTDTVPGVRLEYWTWPEYPERVDATFHRTGDAIRYFDSLFAYPYPWGIYRQVMADEYIYGGMENTTATILADELLVDQTLRIDTDPDGTIAHEIVHQWFGDLVTVRDWKDLWIHESFATYLAARYLGSRFGETRFASLINEYAGSAAWSDREHGNDPIVGGDNRPVNIYGRGAVVLHMLHGLIGDAAFTKGMRGFLRTHAGTVVTTDDVVAAFEEASGMELDWFFDQWIYGEDIPVVDVTKERRGDSVRYRIAQDPRYGSSPEVFRIPTRVDVYYEITPGSDDMTRKSEDLEIGEKWLYTSWYPSRPTNEFMVLAPNGMTLLEVDYDSDVEELWDMMHVSPHAVDRFNAATRLAVRIVPFLRTANSETLASIAQGTLARYREEPEGMVRSGLLLIGALTNTAAGRQLVQSGTRDPDSDVRLASLGLYRFIASIGIRDAYGHLLADSSSYVVARTLRLFRETGERLRDREHERLSRILGVRESVARNWVQNVAAEGRTEWVDRVAAYAVGGSGSLRVAALRALGDLGVVNENVRAAVLRGVGDEDEDIVDTARAVSRKLGDSELNRKVSLRAE